MTRKASPLRTLADAISKLPLEGPAQPLPEEGDSEMAALSRAVNRLQERRQELEETRQQMLASLVHEIGRPLGSLGTALHALKSGAINDPSLRDELIKGMSERIDRIGRLLEDLALTYHGFELNDIHLKKTNLKEWLETLTPLWVEAARQKQQVFEIEMPDDIPPVHTDPDRLAQALGNLVNNAIKFTPDRGIIKIILTQDEHNIDIRVSDTGNGISLENQKRLFEPFFQGVHPGRKTSGLGLGLSIAQSIAESLGGQLYLERSTEHGCVFTISIPIQ